jgi:hypothetical protein
MVVLRLEITPAKAEVGAMAKADQKYIICNSANTVDCVSACLFVSLFVSLSFVVFRVE